MNTPTPETDGFSLAMHADDSSTLNQTIEMCMAFARKLERERDEARQNAQDMIVYTRKFSAEVTCKLDALEKLRAELYERSLQVAMERDQLQKDKARMDWLETTVQILPARCGAPRTLHAAVMATGVNTAREAIDRIIVENNYENKE